MVSSVTHPPAKASDPERFFHHEVCVVQVGPGGTDCNAFLDWAQVKEPVWSNFAKSLFIRQTYKLRPFCLWTLPAFAFAILKILRKSIPDWFLPIDTGHELRIRHELSG